MSSRDEPKEAAEAAREQETAAALVASRRRRLQLVGGGVVALAVVVVAVVALSGGKSDEAAPDQPEVVLPTQQVSDLRTAAKAAGVKIATFKDSGTGEHTTDPVHYPMNPPTNGPHYPDWAADGNYAGRTTPQPEKLVHALEHGRIEIQYRPGLPAAQVAQLEALFDEAPQHVLLFENTTGMKGDVAVTAWTHSMVFPSLTAPSIDAIRAFREQFRDKGPEYVA